MRSRRGLGLLEVIAALAILATVGLTLIATVAQSIRAVEHAQAAEAEVAAANAFLNAVALWSRDDLDRHLGDRPQGPWRMYVERVIPELYRVTLRDSTTHALVLETELHRPQAVDDRR